MTIMYSQLKKKEIILPKEVKMNEDIIIVNMALVDHCEENRDYYREHRRAAKELFEAAKRVTGVELTDLLYEED